MKFENMGLEQPSSSEHKKYSENSSKPKNWFVETSKAIVLGGVLLAGEVPGVEASCDYFKITPVTASLEVKESTHKVQVHEVGDISMDAKKKDRRVSIQWSADLGDTLTVSHDSFSRCSGMMEVEAKGGAVEISGFGVDTFFQIYKKGTFSDTMIPAKDMQVEGAIALQLTKEGNIPFLVFPDGKKFSIATDLWGEEYGALAIERTAKLLHDKEAK